MIKVPEEVNQLIDKHISMINEQLPDLIKGYYIFGSVSLGSFNSGYSDVDFLVIVSRELRDPDITLLKQIHKDIKNQFSTDLMGLYVMEDDLLSSNDNKNSCPCFIDGEYKGLVKFDKNSIDAFQIKNYGIPIKRDSIVFDYEVDWDVLIKGMKENLNTYWKNWLSDSKKPFSRKFLGMFIDLKSIEWGVLGVSRLYFTFKEKDIASKVGAGEYALKSLPSKWSKIINEAMRLRKATQKSYYSSIFVRRNEAIQYMEYIIEECNRFLG